MAAPVDRLSTLPTGTPEFTLGYWAIRWAEGTHGLKPGLIQPNGPRAGKPLRLTRGQKRFLLWWYAVDSEGRWLFHHGVRRLAKGSGKSPFAAILALIEFCGPVRLAHLDIDHADPDLEAWGWSVGRTVDMPLVQIAATAESQTSNTMRMVRAFAPKKSAFVEYFNLDAGKVQYYKLPEGTLEVITSSPTAAEGGEASFVIGDETEHWKPNNGGVELASTLEDNLAKSGSRMLETSNAWVPGQASVAEDTFNAWVAQEEGRTQTDTTILYDAVIAPADTDMADPDSLRQALRDVYDDCDWKRPHGPDGEPIMSEPVDVEAQLARIWSPKAKPSDSKRKYLNRPAVHEDAWVTPEQWALMVDTTRVVADREQIVLFFDGSKSRDATALVACCVSDGHIFVPDGADQWEPNPAHDSDDTVDVEDVDRVVRLTFDRYRVAAFFADVREFESYVLSEWPNRYGADLELQSMPSGKPPQSIAWDMRSHKREFAVACEAAEAEIIEGAFTHDGNAMLARHIGNTRRRPYLDMISVGKESADSPNKIDAAVCAIGARMVRRLYLGARGKKKKHSGIVMGIR